MGNTVNKRVLKDQAKSIVVVDGSPCCQFRDGCKKYHFMNPIVTLDQVSLQCQSCHRSKRGYSYVCGFCQVPYCESCIKTFLMSDKKFDDSKVQFVYKWKSDSNERLRRFKGRKSWSDDNYTSKKSMKKFEKSEADFASKFCEKELSLMEARIKRANPKKKFNKAMFRRDHEDTMYQYFMHALKSSDKVIDAIEAANGNKHDFDFSAVSDAPPPDFFSIAMSNASYFSDSAAN